MNTIKRVIAIQFFRYILISSFALGIDYFFYALLVKVFKFTLPSASAIGYFIGLIVAYFLMVGRVFERGWLRDRRLIEFSLFMASGMLGMMITYLTVSLYLTLVGLDLHKPKILAIATSFVGVYLFRKYIVFRSTF